MCNCTVLLELKVGSYSTCHDLAIDYTYYYLDLVIVHFQLSESICIVALTLSKNFHATFLVLLEPTISC